MSFCIRVIEIGIVEAVTPSSVTDLVRKMRKTEGIARELEPSSPTDRKTPKVNSKLSIHILTELLERRTRLRN